MSVDVLLEVQILTESDQTEARRNQAYRELVKLLMAMVHRHISPATLASLGLDPEDLVMVVLQKLVAYAGRNPGCWSNFPNEKALRVFILRVLLNYIRQLLRRRNLSIGGPTQSGEGGSDDQEGTLDPLPESLAAVQLQIEEVFEAACHNDEISCERVTLPTLNRIKSRWQEFFDFGASRVTMNQLYTSYGGASAGTRLAFERAFNRDREIVRKNLNAYADLQREKEIDGLATLALQLFEELAYIR